MSSPFASLVTETIPIATDPPNTATIRKLRGRELEAAQRANLREFIAGQSSRAWSATLRKGLLRGVGTPDADVIAALQDPLLGFDRYVIVKAALLAWTYAEGTPAAEQIDDLDDDTIDLLARAILRLSKPALFLSKEDAQKEAEALAPRAGGTRADAA